MANSLTVTTCNISGIRNNKKRNTVFNWLKSLNYDIIFLQETHCHFRKEARKWSSEWGPQSFWSLGSSHSKGVAVLFNPSTKYNIVNEVIDANGRYIFFDLCIGDDKYKFINIYAPNDGYARVKFFNELNTWVELDSQTLIAGDFNCTLDTRRDRLNCSEKLDIGQIDLKKFMHSKSLEDVWRRRFPDTCAFSWSRGNKSSRLDYWLISESLDSQIDKVYYLPCVFSDHDMATLKLSLSNVKHGPGVWKMNATVITSDLFKKCFINMWNDWRENLNNFSDCKIWWDLGKKRIKDLTIWCASKLKQDRNYKRIVLENQLKSEKLKLDQHTVKIHHLEESLKTIYHLESEGVKIRSRVQWYEEGEQSTRYFHNLEKAKAKNKSWEKILNKNNDMVYGTKEIIKTQVEFYKNLYTTEGINQEDCEFFGRHITRSISPGNRDMLNKELQTDEISLALKKMKNNKSPGPDGIITEFYKLYWDFIKDDLIKVYRESYLSHELSYSQYLAVIVLLYKKGIREKITNWRPISLNNTDIKILSKTLAERLKIVLPEIIDVDQSGCIKGRKIGHNIRLIEDVLESMDDENLILLIDQQKAFDRVEWDWLFYILKKFGFGEYFIDWIKILYKGMKSAILTNGVLSPYFSISRGIRQGDALSALLYIIQSEPLSECIRYNGSVKGINVTDQEGESHEIKGCQYVDDSTNMLLSVDYIHDCLGIIEKFGNASGSKINRSKTVALVTEHFQDKKGICSQVKVTHGIEKVLGVPMGKGQDKGQFWIDKIENMKKRLQAWNLRDLSMFGKVYVIRSLILPLIQYASAHVHIDKNVIQIIQKLIWEFVWQWKTCFVARHVCYLPRHMGGLNIPNLNCIVKASRIRMVIDILQNPSKWNILAQKYLSTLDKHYDIKWFALLVDESTEEISKCDIPDFYKQCLIAFQELNRKGRQNVLNDIIWCNSKIKFKNKVLSFRHWSKDGIKYISHLINDSEIDKNTIESKLKNKAGFVFEVSRLVKSVLPDMIQSCNSEYVPSISNMYYKIPEMDGLKHVFDLTSKDIYTILLYNEEHDNKSVKYWKEKLKSENIDYNMWYKKLFVCKIMPRKVLDFNWRIFHGQIVTEKRLIKMKLSDGICTSCNIDVEDVTHLFVNCSSYKPVWNYVSSVLENFDIPELQPFNMIVGFIHEGILYDIVNTFLSMARWVIWKRRCSLKFEKNHQNTLNIVEEFRYSFQKHIETLLQTSIIPDIYTKNKLRNFLSRL